MSQSDLDSFRQLPQNSDPENFWIASVIRIPGWIDQAPQPPRRPYAALILTRNCGIHLSQVVEHRADAIALLLPALAQFAQTEKVRQRPSQIVTDQPDTESALRDILQDLAEVVLATDLPPLDAVKQELAGFRGERPPIPSPFSVPGVTRQDLRAFAQSAADFYRAAPWRYLNDYDLIHIVSPTSADRQKYCVVMGSAGQTFGLAFYQSRESYNSVMQGELLSGVPLHNPNFTVTFDEPWETSFAEHDLWEDESLPLAAPNAYPFAGIFHSDRLERPSAALLDHTQAVMAALATTTEAEIDTGRWSKTVSTLDGPKAYTLSIPSLLKSDKAPDRDTAQDPQSIRRALERKMSDISALIQSSGLESMDEINAMIKREVERGGPEPQQPDSPRRRAAELLDRAAEVRGRRQIQLAHQALAIDPDCADAFDLLAHRAGDPVRRIELAQQAVEAGRRAIGDEFDSTIGHFWGVTDTRPYMRARCSLAMFLRAAGHHQESLDHLLDMLRLNPGDNQGIRDLVPASLLALQRNQEVLDFTQKIGRDTAIPAYAAALAAFRLQGDSPQARELRATAIALNRYLPNYLAGKSAPAEDHRAGWSPGKPSEASYCLEELETAWTATPGSIQWLASEKQPPAKKRRRK